MVSGVGMRFISKISFTGTVRCSEALGKLKTKYNIVVNIQGDEPLIDPAIIDGVVLALQVLPIPHSNLNISQKGMLSNVVNSE